MRLLVMKSSLSLVCFFGVRFSINYYTYVHENITRNELKKTQKCMCSIEKKEIPIGVFFVKLYK